MLYLRIKEGDGYRLVPVTDPDQLLKKVETKPTASASLVKSMFVCSLCQKKFPTPGVASMHFARRHKEYIEDKDSWRRYMPQEPVE